MMRKICAVLLALSLLLGCLPTWAQETREGTIFLEGMQETIVEARWEDEQGFELWYDAQRMLCREKAGGGCEIVPLDELAQGMASLNVARYDGDTGLLEELEAGLEADGWLIEETTEEERSRSIQATREGTMLAIWLLQPESDLYCLTLQYALEAAEGWGARFEQVAHSFRVLPDAVSVHDLPEDAPVQLTIQEDGQPIELRFEQPMYGVSLCRVDYSHETNLFSVSEVLYRADKQEAGSTLSVRTMIPEIIPDLLVSGVTQSGQVIRKLVTWSGMDGSTLLMEGDFDRVSEQEALGILYAVFGERDEQTGNIFSYQYESEVEQQGENWHWLRLSWLVGESGQQHVSFLSDLMVSVKTGEVYMAVQENGQWNMQPLLD